MDKGFVYFNDSKIPFVIENYRMELFTDEPILNDFCKEYNFKGNFILLGQCFYNGGSGRNATFLVENSMGSTCYLRCYIINMFDRDENYDTIGVQSSFLDDVFRYQYNYIDMVRQGINFSLEPKEVYKIPFSMQDRQYELSFLIGYDNKLGLPLFLNSTVTGALHKILFVDSSRNREEAFAFQFLIQLLDDFVGVGFRNAQFLRYFLYSHKACVFHFITPFVWL